MGSFWSQVMYIPSDHELMKPNWEPVYTLHSQNYYFCIYHTIACGTAHCMIIISITNETFISGMQLFSLEIQTII